MKTEILTLHKVIELEIFLKFQRKKIINLPFDVICLKN